MVVRINDDFDLNKIIYSGQCFRPVLFLDDLYRFIKDKNVLYIKKVSDNTYDAECSKKEWDEIWQDYFDLNTDYAAIRKSILPDDEFLNKAAKIGTGIRILKQDYFEMIISFIISQRKSIPAIKSSVEKLCERYGEVINTCHGNVYAFPTPERLNIVSEEELKECGLGYRVPYIKDACKKICNHEIDLNKLSTLSDDELLNTLLSMYGVGIKVANCISLFGYHRIKLAPVDTWIKKVIDNEYNGVNPFYQYPDNAGIMQQYMFYAAQTRAL